MNKEIDDTRNRRCEVCGEVLYFDDHIFECDGCLTVMCEKCTQDHEDIPEFTELDREEKEDWFS